MRFKVGDKVRVREDLVIHKAYGSAIFVDCMDEFKGKIVTIDESFSSKNGDRYRIKETGYNWSEEMLEPYFKTNNKVKILKDECNKEYIDLIVSQNDYEFNVQFYLDRITVGDKEIVEKRESFGDIPMSLYPRELEVSFDLKTYNYKKLKKKMTKKEIEKELGCEIEIVEE